MMKIISVLLTGRALMWSHRDSGRRYFK